jgi:hypothetical protein
MMNTLSSIFRRLSKKRDNLQYDNPEMCSDEAERYDTFDLFSHLKRSDEFDPSEEFYEATCYAVARGIVRQLVLRYKVISGTGFQ